jgi:hypothetical protein
VKSRGTAIEGEGEFDSSAPTDLRFTSANQPLAAADPMGARNGSGTACRRT